MSELNHGLVAVDPQPKDYMPIDLDFWHLIIMDEHYEPLYTYIDEVAPYDGEVGRYPTKGGKVRLIIAEGEKA